MKRSPFPENAAGPFYVENGYCIACEAPESEAPDLMAHDDGDFYHCYFKRQPSTPEERARAVMAVKVSCCGAVRYAGDDPVVLVELLAAGCGDQCDAPGSVVSPEMVREKQAEMARVEKYITQLLQTYRPPLD